MKQRFLAILLVLSLLFTLSACSLRPQGGDNVPTPQPAPAPAPQPAPEPTPNEPQQPTAPVTPEPAPEPEGPNGAPDQNDIADAPTLWRQLGGVYRYDDAADGMSYFVYFPVENGVPCFTSGALFSGYVFGGPISDFQCLGGTNYRFTVNVPAREATEMDDGYEAYSFTIALDMSKLQEGGVVVNNVAGNGSVQRFDFAGATFEDVTL